MKASPTVRNYCTMAIVLFKPVPSAPGVALLVTGFMEVFPPVTEVIWRTDCRALAGTRGQVTVRIPSCIPALTSDCWMGVFVTRNNSGEERTNRTLIPSGTGMLRKNDPYRNSRTDLFVKEGELIEPLEAAVAALGSI